MRIGIMQGRLLPPFEGRFQCFPRDRWEDEFLLAEQAGVSAIEWIYDEFGASVNPIATEEGVERVKLLSSKHAIDVHSVCADYFMDKPLLRANDGEKLDRVSKLLWLLQRCEQLSIEHIVLPFVDASKIENASERAEVAAIINSVVGAAEIVGIELHLETSLPPEEFSSLLKEIPNPWVKVNYDSGNSASLGYDVKDEFRAYGERIGSVHIKDRVRGGGTVPLGTGDADLPALFEELKKIDYRRRFVLQVARGKDGEEVAWIEKNRFFVEHHWPHQTKQTDNQ
jgi:L-ribulose-5-phosphate 3-epimerase